MKDTKVCRSSLKSCYLSSLDVEEVRGEVRRERGGEARRRHEKIFSCYSLLYNY